MVRVPSNNRVPSTALFCGYKHDVAACVERQSPRPQLSTNSPNTHALDPLREWLWYRIIIAGCGLPKRSFGISIRLDEPIGQMTLPQESSCGTSDQLLLPIRHGRRDQMTSSEDLTSWRNMEMDFNAHLAVLMKVGCNGERRTGNVRKWGTL